MSGRRTFGEMMIVRRLQMQMTQAALAKVAECSRNYISLIERQEVMPSMDIMDRICGALGVKMTVTFELKDESMKICPFCGGVALLRHVSPTNSLQDDEYRVECGDCGSAGRSFDEPEPAIAAWNERATQVPQ